MKTINFLITFAIIVVVAILSSCDMVNNNAENHLNETAKINNGSISDGSDLGLNHCNIPVVPGTFTHLCLGLNINGEQVSTQEFSTLTVITKRYSSDWSTILMDCCYTVHYSNATNAGTYLLYNYNYNRTVYGIRNDGTYWHGSLNFYFPSSPYANVELTQTQYNLAPICQAESDD